MKQIITIPDNTKLNHVVTNRLVEYFIEAELTAVQQCSFLVGCLERVEDTIKQSIEEGNTIELNGTSVVLSKKELQEIKEDFTTLVEISAETIWIITHEVKA